MDARVRSHAFVIVPVTRCSIATDTTSHYHLLGHIFYLPGSGGNTCSITKILAEPLDATLPTHEGSETSLDWADKNSLLQEKPHIQDLCRLRRQAATCERVDVRQKNGITFCVLVIKQEVFFFPTSNASQCTKTRRGCTMLDMAMKKTVARKDRTKAEAFDFGKRKYLD
jgi:hypothetical protein